MKKLLLIISIALSLSACKKCYNCTSTTTTTMTGSSPVTSASTFDACGEKEYSQNNGKTITTRTNYSGGYIITTTTTKCK